MNPLPTLDVLLAAPVPDPERMRRTAERAIAAAVSDWQAIRAFDAVAEPADPKVFDRPASAAVREQYEAWVAAAEALTARTVAVAERTGGPVEGAVELRHTIGKTLAQLSVTLDKMQASANDYAAGRFHVYNSVEEIRREFRLRPRVR